MSKKGVKFKDIEVQDERIINIMQAKLTTPFVENMLHKFMEFTSKIEEMVQRLSKELFSKACETQNKRIASLENECAQLCTRLEEIDNNSRLNSLVLHGLGKSMVGVTADSGAVSGPGTLTNSRNHLGYIAMVTFETREKDG